MVLSRDLEELVQDGSLERAIAESMMPAKNEEQEDEEEREEEDASMQEDEEDTFAATDFAPPPPPPPFTTSAPPFTTSAPPFTTSAPPMTTAVAAPAVLHSSYGFLSHANVQLYQPPPLPPCLDSTDCASINYDIDYAVPVIAPVDEYPFDLEKVIREENSVYAKYAKLRHSTPALQKLSELRDTSDDSLGDASMRDVSSSDAALSDAALTVVAPTAPALDDMCTEEEEEGEEESVENTDNMENEENQEENQEDTAMVLSPPRTKEQTLQQELNRCKRQLMEMKEMVSKNKMVIQTEFF